jgi:hypothetical protein
MHISPCRVMILLDTNWGEMRLPLEEWIEAGPGLRTGRTPDKVYCEEDGSELPHSIIPLQFRNDYLSKFLIAIGFIEYPWRENYDQVIKYYGPRFGGNITLTPSVSSNESHQWQTGFGISLETSVDWQGLLIESFGKPYTLFTNSSFLPDSLERWPNNVSLFSAIEISSKESLSLDNYSPDEAAGRLVENGTQDALVFSVHEFAAKPFALITVVHEIPPDKHSNWRYHYLLLFGLSNVESYEQVLRAMRHSARSAQRMS